MLRQIVRARARPQEANALRAAGRPRCTARWPATAATPLEAARALRAAIDGPGAASIAAHAFSDDDLRAMLAGLVDDGLAGQYRDYAGAEQATMAIGSLLELPRASAASSTRRGANAALDRLHAAVKDDEKYRPAALPGTRSRGLRAALDSKGSTPSDDDAVSGRSASELALVRHRHHRLGPGGALARRARRRARRLARAARGRGRTPPNTIYKYQKGKHVMAEPQVLPLRSPLSFARRQARGDPRGLGPTKSSSYGVNVRYGCEVTAIEGERRRLRGHARARASRSRADKVVLAIGLQGNLRTLGVPGEDLRRACSTSSTIPTNTRTRPSSWSAPATRRSRTRSRWPSTTA